ncbi:hypothetical protein D3C72_2072430 [compost metagenome]
MLNSLRFALTQVGAASAGLDTVSAGIGEEKRTVVVADDCMMIGQVTLLVRDHPVTILGPSNHPACLFEGFAA